MFAISPLGKHFCHLEKLRWNPKLVCIIKKKTPIYFVISLGEIQFKEN
jgi:hypothetical protein